jgi:hypothetical protein
MTETKKIQPAMRITTGDFHTRDVTARALRKAIKRV